MQSHIALFNVAMAPPSSTAPVLRFLLLLAFLFHSVEWHRRNKHSLFFEDSIFYFNYVYFCGYMPMSASTHSGHKGESDPVELKLQVVVNYMYVDSRNQSQIL